MYPNFTEEKKLWRQGIMHVAGLDEAGRGPLAGPVVAAAVSVRFQVSRFRFQRINDSKKLSEKQRNELYSMLISHREIAWGIGIVSEKIIDKINILQATKLAMQNALQHLEADFLLLDGNFTIPSAVAQKSIIKGDQKVFSIAAASIIAKVTRDRLMLKLHEKYPEFGFDKHKGYGTALHLKNLRKFGLCKAHRKTFYPVSSFSTGRHWLASDKKVKYRNG